MQISFFRTSQISVNNWISYSEAFNLVFKRHYEPEFFKHKYTACYQNESYHGFLIEQDVIVGGCTAIPYKYEYFGSNMIFALLVDAFILDEYRKNEFALFDAYDLIRKNLKYNNIPFIISVPNDVAYPIWKELANWKDIGKLSWYIFPVKFGNIFKRFKLLNVSRVFAIILAFNNLLVSFFFNSRKKGNISITDEAFVLNRFSSKNYIKIDNTPFYLRIYSEDGVRTGYLMNQTAFSYTEISKAILNVIMKQNLDIIIYIGKINFHQAALFKLPQRFHPREFHFCGYEVISGVVNKDIYSYPNWDFGLSNFDVR